MTLTFSNLQFAYGSNRVLSGVDFELASRQMVVLTGANGVGKTTLLRLAVGLLFPTAGTIELDRQSLVRRSVSQRRRIGYVPVDPMIYPGLTAWENAIAFARLWTVDREALEGRGRHLFAELGLDPSSRLPANTLSRGMQQRLSLALGLLHDPDFLFLDEPFSNLDSEVRDAALTMLETHVQRNKAVLLAAHDVERFATPSVRTVVLEGGRVHHVDG